MFTCSVQTPNIMKDLSFFQLKNVMGAKMKKGFKNFCNNDTSTSTLNHQTAAFSRPVSSLYMTDTATSDLRLNEKERESQTTLEEMLLQLDMEEKMAKREKLNEYGHVRHRMSCVNSSDILRTARNALNQYPRFSLDGKDSMYRSSFRDNNMSPLLSTSHVSARKSVCCTRELRKVEKLPGTIAGERVVWCKPGVVAKLMGLEAMPISIQRKHNKDATVTAIMKRQSLRKRSERYEMENRRRGSVVDVGTSCGGHNCRLNKGMNQNNMMSSASSKNGYCIMKPVAMDFQKDYPEVGSPMRGSVTYRNNKAM